MPKKKDPLLAAVLDDRQNLDARRVYADSLMDQGDPRGDFIALQIEISEATGFEDDYPEKLALAKRMEAEHGPKWLQHLVKTSGLNPDDYGRVKIDPLCNATFREGFVSCIALEPEGLDKKWKAMQSLEPLDGAEIVVHDYLDEKDVKLKAPSSFRRLKISPEGWVTALAISQILHWGLESAMEVDFSGCDLGVPGAKLLIGEESKLGDFHDDFETPEPLNADSVRKLLLRNTALGDEGVSLLSEWQAALQLTVLDIGQCRIEEQDSVKALKKFTGLRELYIGGNTADFAALKGWKTLKQLRALGVPQTMDAASFKSLFGKPSDQLTSLDLSAAKDLAANPQVISKAARQWLSLNLGSTSMGDDNVGLLLEHESAKSLVDLTLNKCSLSDKGLQQLLNSGLERLVTLDISSNKLSDASLEELAEWPGIEQLTFLRIRNNRKLSSAGLQKLIDCPQFQPVRFDVGKCKDKQAEKALAERFGPAALLE